MHGTTESLSTEYNEDDLRIADMLSEGGSGAPTRASPRPDRPVEAMKMDDDGGPVRD